MSRRRDRRSRRTAAAAIPLFLALSFFALWPLGTSSNPSDHNSTLVNSWLVQWNIHAVSTGRNPLSLPIFSGFPDETGTGERLLMQSIPAAVMKIFKPNQFLTHNLLLVLFLAIAGYAAALLAIEADGSASAALYAGAAVVLLPWFQSQTGYLQLFSAGFSILAITFTLRFVRDKASGWPILLAVFAQSLSSSDLWLFMNLALFLMLPFLLRKETRRRVPGFLGFWAGGNALGLPFVLDCLTKTGSVMTDPAATTDAAAFLAPWSTSLLLNWMRSVHVSPETALWPGLATAAGLIWFMCRGKVNWMDKYLLLCSLTFAFLSLGPSLVLFGSKVCPAPFRFLSGIPGFSSVTVPARAAVFALFPMAVLAGKALSRNTLLVILGILAGAAGVYHLPLETVPVQPQPWHQWLAEMDFDKVIYLPVITDATSIEAEALRMAGSVSHFTPSVNGYSTNYSGDYSHAAMILNSWPSPEAERMAEAFGVDCILVEGWQPFHSDTVFTHNGMAVAAVIISGN